MTDLLNMRLTGQRFVSRRGMLKTIAAVVASFALPCGLPIAASATDSPAPVVSEATPCDHSAKICLPRTTDEIWLVSTRGLGCPDCESSPKPDVWRYDCAAHQWNSSSLEAFLAAQEPSMPTVFWVHGNRMEAGEAQSQGLSVYRQLTYGVSGDHPIRFVIFSWPASPIHGLREDARQKARRTNIDGYYLGWLVNQIDPSVRVNFIGYSFGARIVTGGLHLLGGGALFGRPLPEPVRPRAPMQAVLVAPAVNNDWLAIGRPHGQALVVVDRMLSFNNTCDRALKRYGVVDPCNRPQALGYTFAVGPLGENRSKLRELDMCCVVGKQHNWANYFYNPGIVAQMRPYIGLAN